ncbi:TetR/AcrR family transcriptional regulator [Paracholeplasma manati]|uniref:TetR/AcrR family transcriptional regulator n=1 Tax=Paracholeplasma manati TaxID=591373 RepID=UPI002407ED85|nr:TetR/AcrR family transcriptional regulator [Paracholeplasma manati]MDG0888304.1 TetR/AcrR family transcriptional regulator [Paracholeplasma manati]
MKDTKELILNAGIEVFSEKGYTRSTTLEISKKAGVSEMTLFRHFQTKNNLFLSAIKQAVGDTLSDNETLDSTIPLRTYIETILHQKLVSISIHNALIRMLIREALSNQLPTELAFTKMIYKQITDKLNIYMSDNQLSLDSAVLADIMIGILLKYAIMSNMTYHTLKPTEQKAYLNQYLNILNI